MFSGAGTKSVPLFQFVNCIDKLPFGKENSTVILEYNFSVSLASFISAKGIAGKLRDMAMYFCKYANKDVDPGIENVF